MTSPCTTLGPSTLRRQRTVLAHTRFYLKYCQRIKQQQPHSLGNPLECTDSHMGYGAPDSHWGQDLELIRPFCKAAEGGCGTDPQASGARSELMDINLLWRWQKNLPTKGDNPSLTSVTHIVG